MKLRKRKRLRSHLQRSAGIAATYLHIVAYAHFSKGFSAVLNPWPSPRAGAARARAKDGAGTRPAQAVSAEGWGNAAPGERSGSCPRQGQRSSVPKRLLLVANNFERFKGRSSLKGLNAAF